MKQITDEKKWISAIEDIKRTFQEAVFTEQDEKYPPIFKEHLDAEKFDEVNARAWEILEPINFSEKGLPFEYDWQGFDIGKDFDKKQ